MSLIPNIWMSVCAMWDVCKRNSLLVSASWPFMFEIYINKSLQSYIYICFPKLAKIDFFFKNRLIDLKCFWGNFKWPFFRCVFFYEPFKANFKLCIRFLSNLCKNDFNTVLDRNLFSIANDCFVNLSKTIKYKNELFICWRIR